MSIFHYKNVRENDFFLFNCYNTAISHISSSVPGRGWYKQSFYLICSNSVLPPSTCNLMIKASVVSETDTAVPSTSSTAEHPATCGSFFLSTVTVSSCVSPAARVTDDSQYILWSDIVNRTCQPHAGGNYGKLDGSVRSYGIKEIKYCLKNDEGQADGFFWVPANAFGRTPWQHPWSWNILLSI